MKSTTRNARLRRHKFARLEDLETRQLLTCDLGATPSIAADLDCDGEVGFSDFLLLSSSFGGTVEAAGSGADLDNDGTVGFGDFSILSSNYGNRVANPTDSDALLSYHDGYWVGQTMIPGSPVPATVVNDIHVDTETGYVTVYAQTRVGNTIVSPVQVGPGETGVLPNGSTLAAHPNAIYLNGSGEELMEADGTGTWWVKHPVIAEEGYYNVEVEAAEYVHVYVEGELQEDGSIRVGGVEENTGAVGFNTRVVNTDTDPDTYTITRYRPANLDPSAGPIDLTPVPDPAGTFTMQRSAGVSPFDGTVYQDTEDPASSIRGQSYTELIAATVSLATGTITTEVWGTQGTDTSPEAAALIDLEAAAQQLGATRVILNGPRYLLADAGRLIPSDAPIQTFGDLEMQRIGSIELDLASAPTSLGSEPYVPQTVSRNSESIYNAGSEIYQLTNPEGEMYVMQSTGTEIENADLAGLGDRLTLPEGWVFEVITLEKPLRVTVSDGDTIDVLVDDLRNAYGYVGIDPLHTSEPTDPTPVASLTANPNPAPTGSNITLTATPVVTAAQVVFFRESNGAPGLQSTDTPVGADTNGADGWTASVNVSTPGTFTYYAVPLVANSPVGTPMATTVIVQGAVETAIPNEPADQVYTTADGVEFVRTPDEQFENLADWPYEPKYVEIDGLRQAYIDEGPEDGPVVLLLHGQPSWSYLYRDMIPVLVDAGYRVIAMDHLGMGRSDKPTDVDYYTYEVHTDRLEQFIVELGLEDINLFAQDWGSLIGLHVAGENPEWFASIAIGNGTLPVIPAGTQPFPPILDTDVIVDVPSPFTIMPAQQVPFRDADGELIGQGPAGAFGDAYFGNWMNFAMTGASFKPSDVVEAMTWFDIPADEQAAYDAPFPSRAYMAGPRSFPSVINDLPGANDQAWAGLGTYDKPFVTIWGGNDPGNLGGSEVQQQLIDHVPGAEGQPHARLPEASHFLQDDQGEQIARQLIAFYEANGIEGVETVESTETRYLDSIFTETSISTDIVYATVDGRDLVLNLVTPVGDTETDRPVMLLANGGAFAFTNRELIIPVAEGFAEAGYVAAVMDYRTQGQLTAGDDFRYAALEATHDMAAAVRFLKANAETFGIDPNKVIVGGASGGAVMAASLGTADPNDPVSDEYAAYLETVGGVYGNVGEHLDQSPEVHGVFAISGAVFGLESIDMHSAPIYGVHNELDRVAPCGTVTLTDSQFVASGTCDFIPVYEDMGVPAKSFIVPGDTAHVDFTDEEWAQLMSEALKFFFQHVVDQSDSTAEILSANLGVIDIRFPGPLENITGAEQQRGDEGMPIVFSVPIDASTLSPEDFVITTASGATTTPTVATLEPAAESDELRTVLLAGPLGSADDMPVRVEIVGSVLSVDGEELQGLASEITTNGSTMVLALVDPAELNAAGNETTPTRIQLTFNGGVTGPFNAELGVEDLLAFRIIDEDGNSHVPTGFEDLGDNDNYVVLLVPPGVTPASVTVQSNTLFSPTNQPNASSSVEVSGTIELEDEHDLALLEMLRERVSDRLAGRMENSFPMGEGLRWRHSDSHDPLQTFFDENPKPC